jgi:MFS family permease
MLLIGLGNAAALLSRYAAAEHHPVGRHGFAIGVVVWAGALGAVGGPLLLGWLALADAFLFAALAAALAAAATLALPRAPSGEVRSRVPLRLLTRTPTARWALAVMATAQVVMGGLMTAAPLGMHQHHATLGTVGTALSAHALGMFVLSPLTGWLLDRFGARQIMLAGLLTMLVATVQLMVAPGDEGLRVAALFQLGYGWNLCFVGGSGSLANGFAAADRSGVEGAVDAGVWGLAAVAALSSTAVFAAGGYTLLGAIAAALLVTVAMPLRSRMNREARTG